MTEWNKLESLANDMASLAHWGQTRKDGEAYICHPRRVRDSAFVNDDDVLTETEIAMTRIVALLHDVVEDTDTTIEHISYHFPFQQIVEAVELVTREEELTYREYVARLMASNNKIAIAVKLGDLTDNIKSSYNIEGDTMKEIREKRWLPTYDKLVAIWLNFPEKE